MKKLVFTKEINASRQKVWDTMLSPETYKKWTEASWPGSTYIGDWKQGEDIKFVSSSGEGTLAHLDQVKPGQYIHANHVAVLQSGGIEDRDSEVAKGWVGITEAYTFKEKNGKTELKVEINTNPQWESMFNDGWPAALDKLKEISEA